MSEYLGTISRGIKAPIIRAFDDIVEVVTNSVLEACDKENIQLNDKDIVGVTEAIVARTQNNYATIDDIAQDVKMKYGDQPIGVIFPILSRNRFSTSLKGIARGAKKIVLMVSYPSDEVGNHLVTLDQLDEKGINPYTDVLTEQQFVDLFGRPKHTFTEIDYLAYYRELIESQGCECEIILANDARQILKYTDAVLTCDIHSRFRSKRLLKQANAKLVYGLDDILSTSVNGSGYNPEYGLLGSNKSADDKVKLFPRDGQAVVDKIAAALFEKTGKKIEVLIYGDGAFKDPVGKIWELADPVVGVASTDGLKGVPNELKLKYLADSQFKDLSGEALQQAIRDAISKHHENELSEDARLGTTPRQLTDLIGSLCDLTSGSGDKGTPIILVQNYFSKY